MAAVQRDWAPVFRWVLLVGGLASSWWTMASGEMPFSMWLGISAIILSGAYGTHLAFVAAGLGLFFLRYALFLTPVCLTLEQPNWAAVVTTVLFTLWESAPLWVAGALGVWALRQKNIPGWIAAVVAAAAHVTLTVWLPRPYHFSWGAPLLARFPGGVWVFGSDLLAGLTLGWICLATRSMTLGNRTPVRTLAVVGAPLATMLVCAAVYESWAGAAIGAPKETHDVIAVQGGLPPFAGGFASTSERLLTPVILYSSLRPDMVIFPECIVQAGGRLDKQDPASVAKRHYAAAGLGIASPYSQVAFGVRDWSTNRIYFTDLIDGKPEVTWKDLEFRTPFVDAWPAALAGLVRRYGFRAAEQIEAPQRTPNVGLLIRDETQPRGLRRIGSGLIAMSGEIRRPLLVRRVQRDPGMTVAINPSIAGWLGKNEAQGSVVQANARAMELGLVLYRVGQRDSTGIFLPWLPETPEESVKRFGPGSLRFKARLPLYRRPTGFSAVFWVFLYLAPVVLIGSAVWLALRRLPRRERNGTALPVEVPS